MEKRAIIAVALSVAVLLIYQHFFMPPPPPVPQKAAQAVKPTSANPAAPAEKAAQAGQAAATPAGAVPEAAVPEKDITVNTSLYTAVISTNGGVIKSWKLAKYKDESGRPLEMVVYPKGLEPLLVVPEGVTWQEAEGYGFVPDVEGLDLSNGNGEGTLNLTYAGPDGRVIRKSLTFTNGAYLVGVKVDLEGYKGCQLYTGESFGSLTTKAQKGYGSAGPVALVDGARRPKSGIFHSIAVKLGMAKEQEGPVQEYSGTHGWAAMMDKYFMAAIVPEDGIKAIVGKGESDWGWVGVQLPAKALVLFYAGPKEYDRLKAMGRDLDRAVDFGSFTFIAKPLFFSLKFFYRLVKNYGWAIIIITVIIKLLFAPLTHKQQKSMKRMQKLAPKINELKEKYKGDPQRLNREMMELYKKERVNPFGGCLPMIIQIPVFIALYAVLNNAIELRGAPFAFWLHDLSARDPYFILPILMGLSMLVMQKMTPTSMDPKQNRIMMIMPVVLTFMFVNLPSGLVLYFTVSNLLSMAQQFYINKYTKD